MTWANFASKSQFTQNVIFHDASLTKVEQQLRLFAWQCTLNKSCSLSYVEQPLFKGHELIQCLTQSDRAHKNQQNVVLKHRKFCCHQLITVSKQHILELCILKTMTNYMLLPKAKLEISHSSTAFTNTVFTDSPQIRSYTCTKQLCQSSTSGPDGQFESALVADSAQALATAWRHTPEPAP